jgi:quercetin dioxygenase-like cupin family protein
MRKPAIFVVFAFVSGVILGNWLTPTAWAQGRRAVQTKDLMRVDLGSWCEGKEALVQLYEFGPGTSGKHFHPAASFVYVLEGSQTQNAVTANVGEVLYDAPGQVHESTNTSPAKEVVFRIAEKGKELTTYVP